MRDDEPRRFSEATVDKILNTTTCKIFLTDFDVDSLGRLSQLDEEGLNREIRAALFQQKLDGEFNSVTLEDGSVVSVFDVAFDVVKAVINLSADANKADMVLPTLERGLDVYERLGTKVVRKEEAEGEGSVPENLASKVADKAAAVEGMLEYIAELKAKSKGK